MTPTAAAFLTEMCRNPRKRLVAAINGDPDAFARGLRAAACFDASQLIDSTYTAGSGWKLGPIAMMAVDDGGRRAVMPFPVSAIEWRLPRMVDSDGRSIPGEVLALLRQDGAYAWLSLAVRGGDHGWHRFVVMDVGQIRIKCDGAEWPDDLAEVTRIYDPEILNSINREAFSQYADLAVLSCYASLAVINSPRLRRVRERPKDSALNARVNISPHIKGRGDFLPWHEIVLTDEFSDLVEKESRAANCDGRRLPWHKVRSYHRKLRSGKEITVKAHERGDARVGIKRARYSVATTKSRPPGD